MRTSASRLGGALVLAAALCYELLVHAASTRPDVQLLVLIPLAGLPHAIAYSSLLWLFGRTLRHGREALITGVARRFHGSLPPYMETYTHKLTAAWCIFFCAQLLGSALLLAFAPLNSWSLFVNVLNIPLLAAMFAGDYVYRVLRYRDYQHATIAQSVQTFAKHLRVS
ncbi:MAG TPA: hypothetical protein VE085_06830 [Burkholderiales bacterium]|nr:hypothetical protein [Burkholderiales bacterium]